MFKGHPKGLYVLFFANMGERFGYYTMIAIFILYLQAKFGFSVQESGRVYGTFLFGVYFAPIFGGWLADNVLGYGKTIVIGIILMILGYLLLAKPGMNPAFVYIALSVICLGTGLFKGNLQALNGNLYDDPRYSSLRDSAFNIFYMGINVGAFFAPSAATGIRNYFLHNNGFTYNVKLPELAHQYINGTLANTSELTRFATAQLGHVPSDMTTFCHRYIDSLSCSYNAGFGIAAVSILASLAIFLGFRKYYKYADVTQKEKIKNHEENLVQLTPEQTRNRFKALGLVFFVVIFFWMAFHQNGFTLTLFAKNYTYQTVGKATYTLFDLAALLPIIAAIIGLILVVLRSTKKLTKFIGGFLFFAGLALAYIAIDKFSDHMPITAELFQQFNPIFIVFLTPLVVGIFGALNRKGKEPSSSKKIAIGMVLAAAGFGIMVLASQGLPSPCAINQGVSNVLVTPYWLISTYFMLTIAELMLSPMGISFVSKVSPPKYKGLMQGGWFAATAVGNLLAGFIGPLWAKWPLWQFFMLLVVAALLSATFMFAISNKLEEAAKS
ncbi:MAG: peptide MFS transporter [Bacteroidota bacterium]|nr:peptide MFS transporter [Bacteroidota bacterium]